MDYQAVCGLKLLSRYSLFRIQLNVYCLKGLVENKISSREDDNDKEEGNNIYYCMFLSVRHEAAAQQENCFTQ